MTDIPPRDAPTSGSQAEDTTRRKATLVPIPRSTASDRSRNAHPDRTIRATPATWRWVCPCQEPPVLLATCEPTGQLNIKVRDRYWRVQGFGTVEAICPRCGSTHRLDRRAVTDAHPTASSAD